MRSLVAFVAFAALALVAQDAAEEAARAYRSGRPAEAYALYEAALADPRLPAGVLHYDLGNCAFRLGRLAEAALCYRRALLRMPRDQDAARNLRIAERRLDLDGTSRRAAPLPGVPLTPGEALALVAGVQAAALVLLVCARRRAPRIVLALVLAVALAGAGWLVRLHLFGGPPDAVVLAAGAALRVEPNATGATVLALRPGEALEVLELSDRWVHAAHRRGRGWIERDRVGLVD